MPYDYTEAPPARGIELIPHGTILTLILHLRAGGVGEDGMLKRSSKGSCEMLDCELVVTDGPYAKRKIWENWILEGTTDGHAKAAEISRGIIKAILDSAFGLKPDDKSPQARALRTKSLKELEGLTFIGKVGIEKGGPKDDGSGASWDDKNILAGVIPFGHKEWRVIEQPPPCNSGDTQPQAAPAAPAIPVARPSWA